MVLWANITALLAPVDLKEATAADLTHSLMGGLVHTCSKPDVNWMLSCFHSFSTQILQLLALQPLVCTITWPTWCAISGSGLQSFCSSRTHLTLEAPGGAVQDTEHMFINVNRQTFCETVGHIALFTGELEYRHKKTPVILDVKGIKQK